MSKINTDKKLELVKAIRMQNQYNRQVFRSREGLLYSDIPERRGSELYSLEAVEKQPAPEEKGRTMSGFRIRFMIALVLLLSFILCDVNNLSYGGENTDTIYGRITDSPDVTELFDKLK